MNIVCFGQMNWDWCWTGKQHLMSGLAQRGHRVLYLDPEWHTPGRSVAGMFDYLKFRSLRTLDHDILVYTHNHNPFMSWRLAQKQYPLLLRKLLQRHGFQDAAAICFLPKAIELLEPLQLAPTIYYPVDEMTAFGGTSAEAAARIRALEDALVAKADHIFAVSPRLCARLATLKEPDRVSLLPNGSDTKHFSLERIESLEVHPLLQDVEGPCIGFIGQVDDRIDQGLLLSVAQQQPNWTFVLVGRIKEGVDFTAFQALPNVRFLGYQPFEVLPRFLKRMDVCIVPYVSSELTESCNPLKVYEYLAAGKPCVARRLEGLAEHAAVAELVDSADEFVTAIARCLAEDQAVKRTQRLEHAQRNSWERRVDVLEDRLMRLAESVKRSAPSLASVAFTISQI